MRNSKAALQRFSINRAGRDLAVGDIHGHFSKLEEALRAVNFDPRIDRLFAVGDLVDRGPEIHKAREWIEYPWFNSVRGNHDDYVVRYGRGAKGPWPTNAGVWFAKLSKRSQEQWAEAFSTIPIAIEVETPTGRVGIVHADSAMYSWDELCRELLHPSNDKHFKLVINTCMWSRRRIELNETDEVTGVKAVVVGHCPMKEVTLLGNVYHIDTMGWKPEGHFTLLNLHTLEVEPHQ